MNITHPAKLADAFAPTNFIIFIFFISSLLA
jgi:hypothetical protein